MSKTITTSDGVELTATKPTQDILNDDTYQEDYSIDQRFIFQAIKAMGFHPQACTSELIDNSVDAESSGIKVYWTRHDSLYKLVLQDNGIGVAKNKMRDVFTKLGNPEDYTFERVGHFGVGAKAAFINLCHEGTITIVSVHNGIESTLVITHENSRMKNKLTSKPTNKPSGTTISIENIETNLSEAQITKICSVMYYPNKVRNSKFTLTVNDNNVEFIDPMYRKMKDKNIYRDTQSFNFLDDDIDINIVSFMPKFDWDKCSKWDHDKGKPSLKPFNSGIYLRLGGRYISLGQQLFPTVTYQTVYQNLRMEITLDKDYIEPFGVQMNKSKLEFDLNDPNMQDFYRQIRKICAEHRRRYNAAGGGKINESEAKSLEDAVKELNKVLKSSGKEKPIAAQVSNTLLKERRKFKGRDPEGTGVEPVGSGKTRTGKDPVKKKKPQLRKAVNFIFEKKGVNMPYITSWEKSKGALVITLNRDNPWIASFAKSETKVSTLWKLYSWIHTSLKRADELSDPTEYINEMYDTVSRETRNLNKWLSND